MANYQLRRTTGQALGAMLGSMWGQHQAKRSLQQLESDIEDLRDVANKTDMGLEDFHSKLSSLYAHHGVRKGQGFDTDVRTYASKVGKRQSAAFAKELYPDKPMPKPTSPSGPPGGWPTTLTGEEANQFRDIRGRLELEGVDNAAREVGDYNRGQARMRTLMSNFTPEQTLNYYMAQRTAEDKKKTGWTKFLMEQKAKQDLLEIQRNKAEALADYQEGTLAEKEKLRLSNAVQDVADRISAEKIAETRANALRDTAKTRAMAGRKPSTAEINLGLILDAISKGQMAEMPMDEILIQAGVMKGKTQPGLREALGNLVFLDDFNEADLDGKIEIIKGIVDSFNPQKQNAPVDAMQWLNMNPDVAPGY